LWEEKIEMYMTEREPSKTKAEVSKCIRTSSNDFAFIIWNIKYLFLKQD